MSSDGSRESGAAIKLTCDVGGTFTDVVLSDGAGRVALGKALTTPHSLIEGLLNAIDAAGSQIDLTREALLKACELFVYSTTQATNAIIQNRTARTALLCTDGFPDILLRREGGSMHLYDFRRPFPEPYIPRHLTFEIPERIGADGEIVVPIDVDAAREVVRSLEPAGVEAVAVSLLWSIANPEHELRLGALLEEELPGVPYTLSHRLNPIIREYRRTSGTAIDASLKPLMQEHLREIEAGLRDAGFSGELVAASSFGGVLPMDRLIERPIFAARSGPSLAPVAGRLYSEHELDGSDAIVCDAGGTSFDVSVVRDGGIVFARETWLGAPFEGHLTGLASVDVRSIGAGGGSIAWLDPGGLLRVGPESAGADPGPACYGRGGDRPDGHRCRGGARLPRPRPLPRRRDGARRRCRGAGDRGPRPADGRRPRRRGRRGPDARQRADGRRDQGDHGQRGHRPARERGDRRWRRRGAQHRRDRRRARL